MPDPVSSGISSYAVVKQLMEQERQRRGLANAIAVLERYREEQTGRPSAFLEQARKNDPNDPFQRAGVSPVFDAGSPEKNLTEDDVNALVNSFVDPGTPAAADLGKEISRIRLSNRIQQQDPTGLAQGKLSQISSPEDIQLGEAIRTMLSKGQEIRNITRTMPVTGEPAAQTGIVDIPSHTAVNIGEPAQTHFPTGTGGAFDPKTGAFEFYTGESGLGPNVGTKSFFNTMGSEAAKEEMAAKKQHRATQDFGDIADSIMQIRKEGKGPTGLAGSTIRLLDSAVDQISDTVDLVGVAGADNLSALMDQVKSGTIKDTGIKNAKLDSLSFSLGALRAAAETGSGTVKREELLRAMQSNVPIFSGSDEQAAAALTEIHNGLVRRANRRTKDFAPKDTGEPRFPVLEERQFTAPGREGAAGQGFQFHSTEGAITLEQLEEMNKKKGQ